MSKLGDDCAVRVCALVIVAMLVGGCRVRRVEPDAGSAARAEVATEKRDSGVVSSRADLASLQNVLPTIVLPERSPAVLVVFGSDQAEPAELASLLDETLAAVEAADGEPSHLAVRVLAALESADLAGMLSAAPMRSDGRRAFDAVLATSPRHWGAIAAAPEVQHASWGAQQVWSLGAGMVVGAAAGPLAPTLALPALAPLPPRADAAEAEADSEREGETEATTEQHTGVVTRDAGASEAIDAASLHTSTRPTDPAQAPEPVAEADAREIEVPSEPAVHVMSPTEPSLLRPLPPAPTRPTWVLVRTAHGRFAAAASFGGTKDALPGQASALVSPGSVLWVAEDGLVALSSPHGRDAALDAREIYALLARERSARAAAAWCGARVAASTSAVVMDRSHVALTGGPAVWAAWTPKGTRTSEASTP